MHSPLYSLDVLQKLLMWTHFALSYINLYASRIQFIRTMYPTNNEPKWGAKAFIQDKTRRDETWWDETITAITAYTLLLDSWRKNYHKELLWQSNCLKVLAQSFKITYGPCVGITPGWLARVTLWCQCYTDKRILYWEETWLHFLSMFQLIQLIIIVILIVYFLIWPLSHKLPWRS